MGLPVNRQYIIGLPVSWQYTAGLLVNRQYTFFIVAPCILIVLSLLIVQIMHTNYYKIVKQLK
jgi:hypothetical protein